MANAIQAPEERNYSSDREAFVSLLWSSRQGVTRPMNIWPLCGQFDGSLHNRNPELLHYSSW
jgi:hypothetical protein